MSVLILIFPGPHKVIFLMVWISHHLEVEVCLFLVVRKGFQLFDIVFLVKVSV